MVTQPHTYSRVVEERVPRDGVGKRQSFALRKPLDPTNEVRGAEQLSALLRGMLDVSLVDVSQQRLVHADGGAAQLRQIELPSTRRDKPTSATMLGKSKKMPVSVCSASLPRFRPK